MEATNGDVEKAAAFLREKGLAKAAKKLTAGRSMNEGLIESYLHFTKRLGVMVEVNCETDFVANTDAFKKFAKEVALHIANLNPQFVKRDDVPADLVESERQVLLARTFNEGKKPEVAEKIVAGRLDKFYQDIVLMEQPWLKDDSKTISQLLAETVAEVGESIEIRRFARFEISTPVDVPE
ncbi:translation elongation factor Ts [Candidatus Flexifilum breve]|uniref:translation elongation factor Ts n=1 Tax=Candidatus Flexifilum breve TaxID=3140694 RepID=UPI0031CC4A59